MEDYLTGCPANPRPFFPVMATVDGVAGVITQQARDGLPEGNYQPLASFMRLGDMLAIRKKGKRVTSATGLRGLVRIKGRKMWHQEVRWMPALASGWRRLTLGEYCLHYSWPIPEGTLDDVLGLP